MVYHITKGIKISVTSQFKGNFFKDSLTQYVFSYTIHIENQRDSPFKLLSRYWEIKDSLNHPIYVQGEGVIGQQPVIHPGECYTYSSGCILKSTIGSMEGHYIMTTMDGESLFSIPIPRFKLIASFLNN